MEQTSFKKGGSDLVEPNYSKSYSNKKLGKKRKAVGESSRVSESSFKQFFMNSPDYCYMVSPDGKIINVNNAALNIMGYEKNELIDKPLESIYAPESLQKMKDLFKKWKKIGKFQNEEMTILTKSGKFRTVLLSADVVKGNDGTVLHSISIQRDITERKLAEEALRDTDKKYRELFETYPEAIVLLDQDLRIMDCNDKALHICGVSKDEIIGQYFGQEIVPFLGEGKESCSEMVIKKLQHETVPPFEVEIINKKGERFWLHISLPSHKNDGKSSTIQLMAHDITELKNNTKELQKYRKHLEDLVKERTSELEGFVYSVSHDLRAPLRSMQSFAQVLLEDYKDIFDHEGKEFAHRIINSSKYMNTLIENLLSYSRLSRKEIELDTVDLTKIMKSVINQHEVIIKERNAEINIGSPLPKVKGHYSTVSSILLNLLVNAVTFVDDNKNPKINIWCEEHDDWIRLFIEDNGIGIAPEYQDKVFRIFERLHGNNNYPGTGIGLAIVKKGIESMGGRVGVESIPGESSTFWVDFKKVDEIYTIVE